MALTWKNPVVIAALGVLVCGAVGFSAAVSHYRLRRR